MGSATSRWMPLNVGDYLAGTAHLSTEEHGAYLLLLFHYWAKQSALPDDDRKLSRICKISTHKWKNISPVIREFFKAENGQLIQERIEKEIAKSLDISEKRRIAAHLRHMQNSSKSDASADAIAKQVDTHTQPTTNNKDKNKSKNKFSDDDFRVVQNIFSLIKKLNPNHKPPNFESWANDIRLMRERDKRTHPQIIGLFEWANNDSFWKTNILSPNKLREKWDTLVIKKQGEKEKATQLQAPRSDQEWIAWGDSKRITAKVGESMHIYRGRLQEEWRKQSVQLASTG